MSISKWTGGLNLGKFKKPFILRKYKKQSENAIGQPVYEWVDDVELFGYVDLLSGTIDESSNAYLTDSTHCLIVWEVVPVSIKDRIYNPRTNQVYEVTYCDNVMELDSHLEIFLKVVAS